MIPNPPQYQIRSTPKFTFHSLALAKRIQSHIRQKLRQFDQNANNNFQQQQIRQLLSTILHESPEELQYVTSNVFRYDYNGDGAVTCDQFIKFCLELHFGEIAIQRLHRLGLYARGRDRVMSRGEFVRTLQYQFGKLEFGAGDWELEELFRDIDVNNKGEITYEDYFTFLREYFAIPAQPNSNPIDPQPLSQPVYPQLIHRISNLIFPQLRTLLIESDPNKSLCYTSKQILSFVQKHIKCSIQTQLAIPTQKDRFGYEEALFIIIQEIFIRNGEMRDRRGTHGFRVNFTLITFQQFWEKFCGNQLKGVKVRPGDQVLREVYQILSQGQGQGKQQGFNDEVYAKFLTDLGFAYIQQYYQ